MGRVEGKVAVITGAAQGIGRAYAECLAKEGAKVVVTDVQDTSAAVSAITDAGGSVIGLNVDVTSNASLQDMVSATEKEFGPIDILINNAAFFASIEMKPFTEITEEEWDLVMRVNLRGPFQAVKAVLPSMIKAGGGRVVNIAPAQPYVVHPCFYIMFLPRAASSPRPGQSAGNWRTIISMPTP